MTRAELVAKVRTKVVDAMLADIDREAQAMRREIMSGRADASCKRDGLTREDALLVFDLVDDFLAHCRKWEPDTDTFPDREPT